MLLLSQKFWSPKKLVWDHFLMEFGSGEPIFYVILFVQSENFRGALYDDTKSSQSENALSEGESLFVIEGETLTKSRVLFQPKPLVGGPKLSVGYQF